eukprot:12389150-Karenia_brevis.AAC.1
MVMRHSWCVQSILQSHPQSLTCKHLWMNCTSTRIPLSPLLRPRLPRQGAEIWLYGVGSTGLHGSDDTGVADGQLLHTIGLQTLGFFTWNARTLFPASGRHKLKKI